MPYSKLYIFTELSANDVKFISVDRQKLNLSKIYTYGTINSIFVEIQPDSTNIKMTLVIYVEIQLLNWTICLYTFLLAKTTRPINYMVVHFCTQKLLDQCHYVNKKRKKT